MKKRQRCAEAAKGRKDNLAAMHPPGSSHALIIGASLTGLMTARVLADYFDQVTLIERSDLPATPTPRQGVPQSHQYHGLMAKGYLIMQHLFPELEKALRTDGIPIPDSLRDFIVYAPNGAGYLPRLTSNICVPSCSRHRLEWHIRRLSLAIPNVTAIPHTEVNRLIFNERKTAVTAVHLHYRRQAAQQGPETMAADLVVDCSGRHSKIERWLSQNGLMPPPIRARETAVHYTTRLFHIPPNFKPSWCGLLVTMQFPQNPRFGGLRQIEDNLWQVALAGLNGLGPPTHSDGFLAYARQLASPIIYEALQKAAPATPAYAYQNKRIHRRSFEKSARFPLNLLIMGDANCCYNPLYGQGMTSAALMVEALQKTLRQSEGEQNGSGGSPAQLSLPLSVTSKIIHQKIADATRHLWYQAIQLDDLWANPDPKQWALKQRLMNKISQESLPLMAADPGLFLKGTEIRHLLRPVWQGINGRFLLRLLGRLCGIGRPGPTNHFHPPVTYSAENALQHNINQF